MPARHKHFNGDSAGVGRTGAFIGLDIAYEHAVSGGDVHVYDVVKRMREERCTMVQAAVRNTLTIYF